MELSTSSSDPSKVSQILKFALSVKLNSKLLLTIADNQTLHWEGVGNERKGGPSGRRSLFSLIIFQNLSLCVSLSLSLSAVTIIFDTNWLWLWLSFSKILIHVHIIKHVAGQITGMCLFIIYGVVLVTNQCTSDEVSKHGPICTKMWTVYISKWKWYMCMNAWYSIRNLITG